MDSVESEVANILAACATDDDLNCYIARYATILQHLVCRMGIDVHQTEAGIRTLYASFADMAVDQFRDRRVLTAYKRH